MDVNFKYICKIAKLYEKKLAELMTKKDYKIFMRDVSRIVCREMIADMSDSDFKELCLRLKRR